jgi:hypothetical protein
MTQETRLNRVWNRVELIVFLIAVVGIMWGDHLSSKYWATLPRQPDAVAGRIHPRNIHGVVVYQTRAQRDRIDRTVYVSFAGIVTAFVSFGIRVSLLGRGKKP